MSPGAELMAASGYCAFLVLVGGALAFAGRGGAPHWPESERRLLLRWLARVVWLLAAFVLLAAIGRHLG